MADKRLSNTSLGKKGEEQAAAVLEAAGMEIVAKNYRSKAGEIDIIALDGETIVFAEVKAWSAFGIEDLALGIDKRKQRKIINTAKFFLLENRKYNSMSIRFDVIFVNSSKTSKGCKTSSGCQISHLASAFTECV